MNKLFDLTGRRALITGSSQGIGLALAAGLQQAGAEVVLNGRSVEKLESAARSLGAGARMLAFDVTDHAAVKQAIDRFEGAVDWRVTRVERRWAGLRSFAPDRAPVYGPDPDVPGFFWFGGQGGFGIQTAPAAALLGHSLISGSAPPPAIAGLDAEPYLPGRLR